MARTSMTSLIATLRGMVVAGTADYTVGSTAYWTDDQLQAVLDRKSYEVREEVLESFGALQNDGSTYYYDYQSAFRFYESTSGGTSRFILQDASGSVFGTASWSANYDKGMVTFGSDMGGSTVYLTGFAYDVYGAAADIWRQKAGHVATLIDFSTDGHNVKRSHQVSSYLTMAERYDSMAGLPVQETNVAEVWRSDLA